LAKLQVSLSKLQKYAEQQGGYDIELSGDELTLSFVPAFPEALEKSSDNNAPPRVIMHGRVLEEFVVFNLVQVEQDGAMQEKDLETAEFTYRSWLQYIEDNY
jgi:hypothetical protein